MQTIKLKGLVDEDRKLSLTLPPGIPSGMVDVIVLVDEPEPDFPGAGDDSFAELMSFHKGRRLGGISLKELATEGRR